MPDAKLLEEFLTGKPSQSLALYHHFIKAFKQAGDVKVHPAKTMIGIATTKRRIAWVTAFGKNFLHVVFPFAEQYDDNLCFQKIAKVPGQQQYNHHFRMCAVEDVNEEVKGFMKLAYEIGLQ